MMSVILPYLNSFALGLALILVLYYLLIKRLRSSKAKCAPQAGGAWPIFGHLPLLAWGELPHVKLAELADKYGPIFTIKIGIYTALVVNTWELAKELYTINDAAISSRSKLTAARILGYDYINFGFSPYGDYWREMRKITALELLSNRRLELLKHIRASEVDDSIKNLFRLCTLKKGETVVDMTGLISDTNANVILRMVAGKRYVDCTGSAANGRDTNAWKLKKTFREFFHLAGVFVLRDAVPFLGWLDVGGYEKAMKRNAEELDIIGSEWLDQHRTERGEQHDFMDVLLSVIDGPDICGYDADTVKKVTAMTLIAGGTDTITVSVTWGLALLLNHANMLRKVQEELDIQVGKERLMNESDIEKLIYLQAVIKETMRLHPAGYIAGPREFNKDCTIAGYHVPAGTRLLVNLYTLQRDPRVWSNPTEFEPERFLDKHKEIDVKGQHFELLPFGAGRRACPGVNFGILMNQLLLASFLQAFEISNPSNGPVDMSCTAGLTNSKATPIEVLLKPRLPTHLYE